MTTPNIRLKRSSVQGKSPTLDNLSLGELGINSYDGNLFARQDTGGVGIATTITNLTPWKESYGGGELTYSGDIVVDSATFNNNVSFGSTVGVGQTLFTDDVKVSGDLSLYGAGSQFFAFNEDTVKVKFANWYSTNDHQYGMGMLWFETYFAALEDTDVGNDQLRRFGWYLETPNHGASNSTSGNTGAHPSNDRMHLDREGLDISDNLEVGGDTNIVGVLTVSTLSPANSVVVVGTGSSLTTSTALTLDVANNRLGIGTATPAVKFHMASSAANETQIRLDQYNNTADAPDIRTKRARGTEASPSDVNTGDYLFRMNVEGMDGGSFTTYGSMQFDVDSSDQDALNWTLQTRDTNGSLDTRMQVNGGGALSVSSLDQQMML